MKNMSFWSLPTLSKEDLKQVVEDVMLIRNHNFV